MSCPYDKNYTTTKDTITATIPCKWSCGEYRGRTCVKYGYNCDDPSCIDILKRYNNNPLIDKNVPTNCLNGNKIPKDCLCGPGYELDLSSNNQCILTNGNPDLTYSDVRTITLKNGCKGNNPKMDPPSATSNSVKCCTGEYTQNLIASSSKCGIGFCIQGQNCIDTMKQYCTSPAAFNTSTNKIDDQCLKYIEKNNGIGASIVSQAILNTWYPPDKLNNIKLYNNPYNQSAIDICNKAPPGTCNTFLKGLCSRFTSRDQLACNGDEECEKVKLLCGCNLPSNLYYDQQNQFVPQECDPICNNPGAVRKVEGGQFQKCNQNLCVFDFENQSQWSNASADFTQACSGNTGSQYSCFVDIGINSKGTIIDNSKFKQNCKSCYYVKSDDPLSTPEPFDCSSGDKTTKPIPIIYIIIGILIIITIILLIVFFARL